MLALKPTSVMSLFITGFIMTQLRTGHVEGDRRADPGDAEELAGTAQFLEAQMQMSYSATGGDSGGGIATDSIIPNFHHQSTVLHLQAKSDAIRLAMPHRVVQGFPNGQDQVVAERRRHRLFGEIIRNISPESYPSQAQIFLGLGA